jgi:Icc-related predicted phosphoesterase
VKILAVSDVEVPKMQNAEYLQTTYSDVDMLISCGDMSAAYLDFICSVLSRPLYYVRGNHDTTYKPPDPGGVNLHMKVKLFKGFSFAGLEGSVRYNEGAIQYTEGQMLMNVLKLMPRMIPRLARKGYGVHVLVAHSPPRGIHDIPEDYAHRGFKAFHYLMRWVRPQYLIHGHVDTWDRRKTRETVFHHTTVLNINPYMVFDLE